MPLPTDPNTLWPPAEPAADYASYNAWYSGDLGRLEEDSAPAGRWQRFLAFWTRQERASLKASASTPHPLHMPLAADIAQTSADLLFGEPVDFKLPDAKGAAQKRLEQIVEESGLHNTLVEAADTCAGMGGVYLRATTCDEVSYPFLTAMQADQAVPEWRWGMLSAVTFWRELARESQKVWRHLERHEGGRIMHGVYLGTPSEIGSRIDLGSREETRNLQEDVAIAKGLTTDVWYVPNTLPNRRARTSPIGRPDIAGSEGALDALDETYSNLMRDVRVGKARVIVPSGSLDPVDPSGGRGSGRTFDLDREVFTELDGLDPQAPNPVTVTQFTIRTQEHLGLAVDLMEKIASNAGYSPQTFGLRIEGSAESGTALSMRERKTYRTLSRKRRYWAPQLQAAVAALLIMDPKVRGTSPEKLTPAIEWPKEVPSTSDQATTLNMLRSAESASTQTRVQMLHPDWDEEKIAAEVERIHSEAGTIVPPPDFGGV